MFIGLTGDLKGLLEVALQGKGWDDGQLPREDFYRCTVVKRLGERSK